jgi:hypothetical protein
MAHPSHGNCGGEDAWNGQDERVAVQLCCFRGAPCFALGAVCPNRPNRSGFFAHATDVRSRDAVMHRRRSALV